MNKRTIKLFIILLIVIFIFTLKASAAESCKIDLSSNSNFIRRGDEIEFIVAVKNIINPIAGTAFRIEYDNTVLEPIGTAQALNDWTLTQLEDECFLYAPNFETISTEQQICKMTFNVKENASLGNAVVIASNIQIVKDDYSVENINNSELEFYINQKDLNIDINYSTVNPTNEDVQVTIISDDELQNISGWSKSSDGKTLSKKYSQNIEESLTVKDLIGNEKNINILIANIDKIAPNINVNYSTEELTNENVLVTITANEKIQNIEGWTKSADEKILTKEYSGNIEENIIVKDLVGNETLENIEIVNIDKTKPIINLTYSTEELTKENVLVTITANEKIQNIEGWIKSADEKILTKEYSENKEENIVVKDLAGNETIVNIKISNIFNMILGDLNDNNQIDIGDILLIYRHIAQNNNEEIALKHPEWKLSDTKILQGDLNKNNQIDIGDSLIIQRYISAMNNQQVALKHPEWLAF